MARRAAFLSVLAAAGLLWVAVGPLLAQDRSQFTAAERADLEAGHLVEHRRVERRGALVDFGGTSFQRIDRPLSEVWRAVRDPASYSHLLPQVDSVRTVAQAGGSAVIRVAHSYGPIHAAYHLRLRFDDARTDATFELDPSRPNDIPAARGFVHLSRWPQDADRTLVSWGVLAAVDDGILGGLLRPQLHDWMLRVPTTMRSYLEGEGRTLFLADVSDGPRRQ